MPGEGVEERVFVVAVTGVNDQSGGFSHDEQVCILIDDSERDIFGLDVVVVWLVVQQNLDNLQRFDLVVAADGSAVHPYVAGIGSGLDAVARGARHMFRQVLIHADGCLALIHLTTPTLKQLVLLYYFIRFAHDFLYYSLNFQL